MNVPSNVSSTVTCLPLTPRQADIIPLKLKRRLQNKGYVMHHFIQPQAVLNAVNWLITNNQLYCGLDVDAVWNKSCFDEDSDTWNGMTRGIAETTPQHRVHDSNVEPSSDSANAETPQPTIQDIDVEPTDNSGNDSDYDVMDKVRGLSFSTWIQPTDTQYAASELCLAPAGGQTPLDFMLDANVEVLAFPAKFPYGTGGFSDERDVVITPKKYFIQRLLNHDKHFASDANYLFFAQYICEMKQIQDNITVAMRKTAGRMSASLVSDADQLCQLVKRDNTYQFLQTVRGNPAYFQRAVKELIAMGAQIGCPQFFITVSAADISWPEVFCIIGQQNGHWMTDNISVLSYNEKSTMLRNDPVLAARHFDHRLKAFFKEL